jgi:hypothetical protein
VISEDVLSREINSNNVLVSKRLLVKERMFHIPKWASSVVQSKNVYVIEEAHCDPINNTLTTYTMNTSLTKFMVNTFKLNILLIQCYSLYYIIDCSRKMYIYQRSKRSQQHNLSEASTHLFTILFQLSI